jgi:hypothetical protein
VKLQLDLTLSYSNIKSGATRVVKKKKESIEVSECETFQSYSEKLQKKYGDQWLGKGKCTGLEFKRWLALRDNLTEIP